MDLECHSNQLAQVVHEIFSPYGLHLTLEQVDWSKIQSDLTSSPF